MRRLFLALAASTALLGTVGAATVFPLDRATILAGSPFDFKVEFDGSVKAEDVKIVINGADYKAALGGEVEFIASEKGKDDAALGSAVLLRGVKIDKAGASTVEV